MSLIQFENSDLLISNSLPFFGQILSDKELNTLLQSLAGFDLRDLDLEIHIYDLDNNLIISHNEYIKFIREENNYASILIKKVLAEYGLDRGKYKLALNFTFPIFGNIFDRDLFISRISNSRTEITLQKRSQTAPISKITRFFDSELFPNVVLNVGNNRQFYITTSRQSSLTEINLKLKEPLPEDIEERDSVFLNILFLQTYIDSVNLDENLEGVVPFLDDDLNTLLSGNSEIDLAFFNLYGNDLDLDDLIDLLLDYLDDLVIGGDDLFELPEIDFNFEDRNITQDGYLSDTDILKGLNQLINAAVSGSVDIGLGFTDGFDSFTRFSSAEARVVNFRKKLVDIEAFDQLISSAENLTSGRKNTINYYTSEKNDVIRRFDEFERFLYYKSGSQQLFTSQSTRIDPWPKRNSTVPYTLYSYTSSLGYSYYETLLDYARNYDRENKDALFKTIPILQFEDDRNSNLKIFMNMLGHHYDTIFYHIDKLNTITRKDNNFKLGPPAELVGPLADDLGLVTLAGTFTSQSLIEQVGASGSTFEKNISDMIKENFSRVSNASAFIKERKGTAESVKTMANAYGLPSEFVNITEFGGTPEGPITSHELKRSFDYLTLTGSSQEVTVPWKPINSNFPLSVSFVICPTKAIITDESRKTVLESTGSGGSNVPKFQFTLDPTIGSTKTDIHFEISSSLDSTTVSASVTDIYTLEEFPTTITLRRSATATSASTDLVEYQLIASQQRYGKITTLKSGSLTVDGSIDADINESFVSSSHLSVNGGEYRGKFYELRYWNIRVTDDQIKNYTLSHDSFVGSAGNVTFRAPLKKAFDATTTGSLNSLHPGVNL